jgi:hypothetical protein
VVLLDGAPVDAAFAIDQLVLPEQLGGVEVYADAAFAPPEYYVAAGRPNCSVVLLWTQ